MSQATLKDVAVHAGVSHQTVSNVLNDHPHVRPATRQRVLKAVAELDYHPNVAAKALREARITALCCAFYNHDADQIADPYRNLIQSSFVAEADLRGYTMNVAFLLGEQPQTFDRLRQRFLQRQMGGSVIVGQNMTAQQWRTTREWGMSSVMFDQHFDDTLVNTVFADYRGGMRELVAHHAAQGRRDLALIIPLADPGSSGVERHEQFLASVQELGLRGRVVNGDWSFDSGERAARTLLQGDAPDAILAGNDRMAAGALLAAHQLGIDVPGTLAISGFDDFEFTLYTTPRLTTVRVPHEAMARAAVQDLLNLIETGEDQPARCFPTELVVRDSS